MPNHTAGHHRNLDNLDSSQLSSHCQFQTSTTATFRFICILPAHNGSLSWQVPHQPLLEQPRVSSRHARPRCRRKDHRTSRPEEVTKQLPLRRLTRFLAQQILYKLHLGEVVSTIPTIGFNVETIQRKNFSLTVWDVGGQARVRSLVSEYRSSVKSIADHCRLVDPTSVAPLLPRSPSRHLCRRLDRQGALRRGC